MSYDDEMPSAKVTLAFDGDAVRDGTIDVRVLGPALLALGDLLEASNTAINDDRARVSVRIRATGQGSFEITFEVIMSLAKQVTAFFAGDEVTGPLNLLAVLGIATKATMGVIDTIKWLAGRKPDRVIENEDGTVTLIIEKETIVVQREVVLIIENAEARKAVHDLVSPLQRDGIDAIEVRQGEQRRVVATKADVPALQAEIPAEAQEVTVDETYRSALTLLSVSFQDGNKWRVSDGDSSFYVTVQDERFQADVDQHRAAFGKDDVLICRVHRRQRSTPSGLKTEHSIVEVLEHKRAMQQLKLLPPGPGKPDED